MSAALRSPADEAERLVRMLSEQEPELAPLVAAMLATHTEPASGVLVGNADIAKTADWKPWSGPRERAPLPGCEHLQGANLDLIRCAA